MNKLLKYLAISLIAFYSGGTLMAQNVAVKDSSKIKDGTTNVVKNTNQLKAKFPLIKVNPPINVDLNSEKKLNTTALNSKLNNSTLKNNSNFLMETLPEDNDIIGKKYWNNKDVTHQKKVTSYSLGTVRSKTRLVKIECRDYSYVDGDRIRIYLNDNVVSDNVGLKGNYYVYYVNLEKGYNKIDFEALNQGFSGPNTAELNVYDENGTLLSSKGWGLATKQIATIGILY
jgi:hypothetical protein